MDIFFTIVNSKSPQYFPGLKSSQGLVNIVNMKQSIQLKKSIYYSENCYDSIKCLLNTHNRQALHNRYLEALIYSQYWQKVLLTIQTVVGIKIVSNVTTFCKLNSL